MKMSVMKGVSLFVLLSSAFGAVPKVQQQHLRAMGTKIDGKADSIAKTQSSVSLSKSNTTGKQFTSFRQYYAFVKGGRGIWKWNNALDAYDLHFARFKGHPVKFGEIGVWSGGSIPMWENVLGAQCYVYGFDVMPVTEKFNDDRCTMTIMDQADTAAWNNFFTNVTSYVDIMVDDGGHQPNQMRVTTRSVWPHLTQGGIMAIEDISGPQFKDEFFMPIADFYGARRAEVASIHMYPLVLIAEKVAPWSPHKYSGSPDVNVTTMEELTAALASAAAGSVVMLQNAAWSSFHGAQALGIFFGYFNDLYVSSGAVTMPDGCASTSSPQCEYTLVNSDLQNKIVGVHIFRDQLVVETAPTPPVLQAVRRGTEWIDIGR